MHLVTSIYKELQFLTILTVIRARQKTYIVSGSTQRSPERFRVACASVAYVYPDAPTLKQQACYLVYRSSPEHFTTITRFWVWWVSTLGKQVWYNTCSGTTFLDLCNRKGNKRSKPPKRTNSYRSRNIHFHFNGTTAQLRESFPALAVVQYLVCCYGRLGELPLTETCSLGHSYCGTIHACAFHKKPRLLCRQ